MSCPPTYSSLQRLCLASWFRWMRQRDPFFHSGLTTSASSRRLSATAARSHDTYKKEQSYLSSDDTCSKVHINLVKSSNNLSLEPSIKRARFRVETRPADRARSIRTPRQLHTGCPAPPLHRAPLEPCLLLAPRWKRVPSELIPKPAQARSPNQLFAARKRGFQPYPGLPSFHV